MDKETYNKIGFEQFEYSSSLDEFVGRMNGIFSVMRVDPQMTEEDKNDVREYLRSLKSNF